MQTRSDAVEALLYAPLRTDGLPALHDRISAWCLLHEGYCDCDVQWYPYFCFTGADFIAGLWMGINDEQRYDSVAPGRSVSCPVTIPTATALLVPGVYRVELATNTLEGHAFVAHATTDAITIHNTLGGCVGFYKTTQPLASWIAALCNFSNLTAEMQPAAFAELFGFAPHMTDYLLDIGHLTLTKMLVRTLL